MKATDVLATKDNWTQQVFGRTADGRPLNHQELQREDACQFCMLGACIRAYGFDQESFYNDIVPRLDKSIRELFPERHDIARFYLLGDAMKIVTWFNDNNITTHDDVLAVLKKAGL